MVVGGSQRKHGSSSMPRVKQREAGNKFRQDGKGRIDTGERTETRKVAWWRCPVAPSFAFLAHFSSFTLSRTRLPFLHCFPRLPVHCQPHLTFPPLTPGHHHSVHCSSHVKGTHNTPLHCSRIRPNLLSGLLTATQLRVPQSTSTVSSSSSV
jgi:hypothetical protein